MQSNTRLMSLDAIILVYRDYVTNSIIVNCIADYAAGVMSATGKVLFDFLIKPDMSILSSHKWFPTFREVENWYYFIGESGLINKKMVSFSEVQVCI